MRICSILYQIKIEFAQSVFVQAGGMDMNLHEGKKFLIVSGTEKGRDALRALLKEMDYTDSVDAADAVDAHGYLQREDFDALIVNTPLSDGFGHELAFTAAKNGVGVLLVVKQEHFDEVCALAEPKGILVITRPIVRSVFRQSVRLMMAFRSRMKQVQDENRRLQIKLEEMKAISRAKGILMEYLRMSEQQAHKYIERQAMDLRISMGKVALGILKTYEP